MSNGISFNAGTTSPSIVISNDFFPAVDLADVRKVVRFDGSVSDERLKEAVINAMLEVNQLLQPLKVEGKTFADYATCSIDGRTDAEIRYFRAVYSATAAYICEHYRSYDSTKDGMEKGQKLGDTIDEHRRNLRWAIRDLLGRGRCTVELI